MTPRKKRLVVFTVILTAAATSAFVYYHYWHREKTAADEIVLYGNIDIRQVDLAFDAADRIVEMHVVEGERVQRGQLLATLDSRRLKLAVERAKAELLRSRHELASAEYLYRDISTAMERNVRAVSGLEHDQAMADVNRLQAIVAVNESQLALAEKNLSDAFLHAPADAIVQTRILEPGDMVSPERAVFALALIDPIWARVFVDEPNLRRMPGRDQGVGAAG
jgi:HlyD family secretion protein